jgi:HTH-type transcriptional regulator / antitoxin HigA
MTTATLNRIAAKRSYRELVHEFPPRKITEKRLLNATYAVIDKLMSIKKPSKDQLEYLDLLASLVQEYEVVDSPAPAVSLPNLLSHLIEAKGVTQSDVARATGVASSTLSEVLANRRSLSIANIKKLAAYFRVPTTVFVDAA